MLLKKTLSCYLSSVPYIIALLMFGGYLFTMVPGVTGDDSGEFAAVGATLGTAHPPGYPLYCLAARGAVTVIPWANSAYRVNLVSAFFISAAALTVYFAALALAEGSIIVAAASGLIYGFSPLVWGMANVTEVYGMAAFLMALMGLVIVRAGAKPQLNTLYVIAFLFGLSMAAHYTAGLLLAGIIWWAYYHYRNQNQIFNLRTAVTLPVFAVMGFSVVLYIYIRANANPLFGWEDPKTVERFWQVIARLRYGSFSLAQGGAPPLSPEMIAKKLYFFGKIVVNNFTWAGATLLLFGTYHAFKDKARGWTLLAFAIFSGPGFLLLANAGVGAGSLALLERFFFLPLLWLALIIAFGMRFLPRYASGAALLIPIFMFLNNAPSLNRRNEFLFYDYAKNMLRTLPPRTLLFSDRADEMEFVLGYLHVAQGMRPDVEFIDCNAGITRSIYGDNYYRIWGKPRLAIREATEKALIAKSTRPVYYTSFDTNFVNIPRVQDGLLFRVRGNPVTNFPFHEVYALRLPPAAPAPDERLKGLLLTHFQLNGSYCLGTTNLTEAERNFRGLTAFDPFGLWDSTLGYLYHSKGLFEQAQRHYERAVAMGDARPETYVNLGAIYEHNGLRPRAMELYQQALSMNPGNVQAHFNLAVIYWRDENWQNVIRELEAVTNLDPANVAAKEYLSAAKKRLIR